MVFRLDAYTDPTDVTAIQGEVVLIGPGPVGISMAPDAARETAKRLIRCASEADEQEGYDPDAPVD